MRVEDDKNISPRTVITSDLHLHVRNRVRDIIKEDYTCKSEYMKEAMKRVGAAIKNSYYWIP